MALAGQAVMINWCDVAEENRPRFYAWHTRHHMMDRVGIPGFQRCRRYSAVQATSDYFFIYEVDSLAVLSSQDYLNRLNNPSPITRAHHGLIVNGQRLIASVKRSIGAGQGGALLTLRFDAQDDSGGRIERYLTHDVMPALLDGPEILSTHLVETDPAASVVTRPGGRAPGNLPAWVLVVEALSSSALDPICEKASFEGALRDHGGAGVVQRDTFAHQVTISRTLSWNP